MLRNPNSNLGSVYKPAFPRDEYKKRIYKLRDIMNKNNIHMIVLASPHNIFYYTGFDGWSFYVPQFFFIYRINNVEYGYKLLIRNMDSYSGISTTYLNNQDILGYPDEYVDNVHLHPLQLIHTFLPDSLYFIGIEGDSIYFRSRYMTELSKQYNNITDITHDINMLRLIKSPLEINYIRKAAEIADKAMSIAIKNVKKDVKSSYIAGEILKVQAEGIYTAISPMIMVDDKAGHMNWTNDIYKKGQTVCLELAGAYKHYHCPISRTVYIGNNKPHNNDFIVMKAIQNALDVVRIDNIIADIYLVFEKTMASYGLKKDSRIGYSFGIGFPPDWGESTISLRKGELTALQENMCIHLIVGCGDNLGFQMSESFIVTPNGPELLCKTPRRLFLSEVEHNYSDIHYELVLQRYCPKMRWKNHAIPNKNMILPSIDRLNNKPILFGSLFDNFNNFVVNENIKPTPLINLFSLAKHTRVKEIIIKDESNRLQCGSFKILGVSYAIKKMFEQNEINNTDIVCTMTDGNHGRALARVANEHGLKCKIFVPYNTTISRIDNIIDEGAEVIKLECGYDAAVNYVYNESNKNGWKFISDQSFEGYTHIPTYISTGYLQLFKEIEKQISCKPTHIFLQVGVGGFASAGVVWAKNWCPCSRIICVEPNEADCFMESIKNNKISSCTGNVNSIMAGLNCGYPSKIAYPIIKNNTDYFLSIDDDCATHAIRIMFNSGVISGDSGCAGLAGYLYVSQNENLRKILQINESSTILFVNTEGHTDPILLSKILKSKI